MAWKPGDGYDAEVALAVCEAVAAGDTLTEIEKDEAMPSRKTIYRWLSLHPKFFDAYERAKELSAQSIEEEAIRMARELAGPNDFTGTKVQAYNVAMGQLRWSAARRDKTRFGQQVQQQTTVPIQINTTLNLAQDGMPAPAGVEQSIYHVEAEVKVGPGIVDNDDQDTLERMTQEGREVIDLSPETSDNGSAFKQPAPRLPRPKPGHKSPARAAATAKRYAEKKARQNGRSSGTDE